MERTGIRTEERTGLAVAVVLHLALLGMLFLQGLFPAAVIDPPQRMTVSLAEDVRLDENKSFTINTDTVKANLNLIPIFSSIISILFLNEILKNYHIVGAILIFIGIFLVNKEKNNE